MLHNLEKTDCRLKGVLTGGLLILALWACGSAGAQTPERSRRGEHVMPPSRTMRVSMDILIDGQPMRVIHHEGKSYLPVARLGTEYEIRITNHGPRRITAVVSVDGLSVISGKPASEDQPGYIVDPGRSIVIKGWRRSLDTVAAFRFVDRKESYAARMGHPDNIGVIGLVAFEEKAWRIRPWLEQKDRTRSAPKRGAQALGGTGTGYGRDIDSRVYYVRFIRSTNKRTITYDYDTVEALRKAGVPVDLAYPLPFPKDGEFAPPLPGHRGL
jgi:hypothetical protein